MATLAFSAFGTSWQAVLGLLGGDSYHASDVAKRTATVGAGSTTSAVVVTDTTGFAAGDKININTGVFPVEGETAVIDSITAAVAGGTDGTINLDTDYDVLTVAPTAGDVINDGPEVIEDVLVELEGYVESRLPSRYAEMLRRIEGEILTRYALDSPTAFTLKMATPDATGTGTEWVNRTNGTVFLWQGLRGEWTDRWGKEMDDDEYSVSGQTVTLDVALSDAISLVAQYDYAMTAASAPKCLGRVMRRLAAAEVADIIGLGAEPTRGEYVTSLREQAEEELGRIADGSQTIPEFDKIELFEDVKQASSGIAFGNLEKG